MAKKIEVWYSADDAKYEVITERITEVSLLGGGASEDLSVKEHDFKAVHTFHTPAEVYQHFLEATEIAYGNMYYVFWRVDPDRPRENWGKWSYTMDEFRNAKDTKNLIEQQWK